MVSFLDPTTVVDIDMPTDVLFYDNKRQNSMGISIASALTQLGWLALLHRITFASEDLTTAIRAIPWMFVVVGICGVLLSVAGVVPKASQSVSNPLRATIRGGLLFTIFMLRMFMLHFCGLQWASLVESASFCLTDPLSKQRNLKNKAILAIAAGYGLALLFPSLSTGQTAAPPSLVFHVALFLASLGLKHVYGSMSVSPSSTSDVAISYASASVVAFMTRFLFGFVFDSASVHIPLAEFHFYNTYGILLALCAVGVLSILLPVLYHDNSSTSQARQNMSVRLAVQYPLTLIACLSMTMTWHTVVHALLSFGALLSISWGWYAYLEEKAHDDYDNSYGSSSPAFGSSIPSWNSLDSATQKILMFLAGNILYMFVEFIVGYVTNSLGLLSDAGHMLFDNGALLIGLVAAMISKWPKNEQYTYGYDRVEVLSGFVNSLLLVFMAFHFMVEAVERIVDPPTITTENLLLTSVGGLIMNVIGLVWFHDLAHGHSHGDGGCHGHNNSNMVGVYLHVLADTMGSLGVIVSSICIDWYGWYIMDPLCSGFISILIFGSTIPLLKETMTQLVQGVSPSTAASLQAAVAQVKRLTFVEDVENVHAWHQAGKLIGSIHVFVRPGMVDGALEHIQVVMNSAHMEDLTIQVEDSAKRISHARAHEHSHEHHGHSNGHHGYSHGHHGHSHGHDSHHGHSHSHGCSH